MEINELNYEQYALDYAEGRLKGDALAAMEGFLASHPGLEDEIHAVAGTFVPDAEEFTIYPGKEELKRENKAVIVLPLRAAWAAAAASVLIGAFLIWLGRSSGPEGDIAYNPRPVIIQTNINLVTTINSAHDGGQDIGNKIFDGQTDQDLLVNQSATDTDDGNESDHNHHRGTDTDIPFNMETDPVMAGEEDTPVAELMAELKGDNGYVIPVTILKTPLVKGGLNGGQEYLARAEEREQKKKLLRDGALSLLQHTMPQGVEDLVSY